MDKVSDPFAAITGVYDSRPDRMEESEKQTPDIHQGTRNDQLNQDVDISQYEVAEGAKRDPYGLPLVPQPSQWPDDPLVSVSSGCLLAKSSRS